MKQGWIAACAVAAMVVPGLAACSGSNSGASAGSTPGTGSAAVGSPGVTSPFVPGVSFTLPTVCDAPVQLPPAPVPIPPAVSISPPAGCTGNLGRNTFVRPNFRQFDLRLSRKFYFTEKVNLEVTADMFNLLNRNNTADVNPLCDLSSPTGTCTAGQPTASLDPRQFQFALKINW